MPDLDEPPQAALGQSSPRDRTGSCAPSRELASSVGSGVRDDDHRARRVVDALLADRAEQEAAEAAEAARADDEQLVGVRRLGAEHVGGLPLARTRVTVTPDAAAPASSRVCSSALLGQLPELVEVDAAPAPSRRRRPPAVRARR